jgi:hypothetical protein
LPKKLSARPCHRRGLRAHQNRREEAQPDKPSPNSSSYLGHGLTSQPGC